MTIEKVEKIIHPEVVVLYKKIRYSWFDELTFEEAKEKELFTQK